MTEYLKRAAVFEQFDNGEADVIEMYPDGSVDFGFGASNIRDQINAIPAADVAPVVHGRWVTHYRSGTTVAEGYVSTCCDMWNSRKSDYCPNCGEKMDGGAENA